MRKIIRDKKGIIGTVMITFIATIIIVVILIIFALSSTFLKKEKKIKGDIQILDEETPNLLDISHYSKTSLVKWGCSGEFLLPEAETIKDGKCVCDAYKGYVSKYNYGTFDPPCIKTDSRKDGRGRMWLAYTSDSLAKVVGEDRTEEEINKKCPEWRYHDLTFITGTQNSDGSYSDSTMGDNPPTCDFELVRIREDVRDHKVFEFIPGKETATFTDYEIEHHAFIDGGKNVCCYAKDREKM